MAGAKGLGARAATATTTATATATLTASVTARVTATATAHATAATPHSEANCAASSATHHAAPPAAIDTTPPAGALAPPASAAANTTPPAATDAATDAAPRDTDGRMAWADVEHGGMAMAVAATQRDDDGLALSSRNQYLTTDERAIAPKLWETLQVCARELRSAAEHEGGSILDVARASLAQAGFAVDYLELRVLSTLAESESLSEDCALFVAARLGRTRLIDNIQITAI